MDLNIVFILNSMLLGIGLAMDAFSVSLANGLHEPQMNRGRMCAVAGVFSGFQAAMPLIGWICIHTVIQYFKAFEKLIPWIALILLCYIGGKMLYDGTRKQNDEAEQLGVGFGALMVQGIATSIDALSVGFTIAEYELGMAIASALIIGAVTFAICFTGLAIGKTVGTRISGKANILGGVILILIGLEIFISSRF